MINKNLKEIYKNKKVYITGITGFKGSWLAIMLHELGAKVSGLGLKNTDLNSIFHQGKIDSLCEKITLCDVSNMDANAMEHIAKDITNSDFVFHLAAQPLVNVGYNQPLYTVNVNLMFTAFLLNYISSHNHKKIAFLNVTTDKVYKPSDTPHKEDGVLFGPDPYSISKSFSDMYTQMYMSNESLSQENLYIAIARAGNVIGGGDFADDRIVTDIVKSKYNPNGKLSVNLKNPFAKRPYQYVLDCLYSYILINANLYDGNLSKDNRVFNVAPQYGATLNKCLCKHFDVNYNNIGPNKQKYEVSCLMLDGSKFNTLFEDNQVCQSISDTVLWTDNWYKAYYNGNNDMRAFSSEQVKNFLQRKGD